ncbi:MAG: alcohol dehydrogenase catalytic domain-containing protein [Actinomycetota bacterium]|nr:alcohol dehydrogenase catalytic domain-containing protein [Actinomycetota bacterium]
MRATVFHGPGDMRVEDVPDASLKLPTDAVVRVTHACICGSDLWFYRGISKWEPGWRAGHEWMGVVEEVGSAVTSVTPGDTVVAPFAYSDGTCEFCRKGVNTSCIDGGFWGGSEDDGGQGEAVRAPHADGTLVRVPPEVAGDESMTKAILPLTDVMGTGHHAAVAAGVAQGSTAVVIGDGAVGLCAVAAARRLGAGRIIAAGHHADRLETAKLLGATDVTTRSDQELIDEVVELTAGGAESVLECVGNQSAMDAAVAVCRPGGTIGYVGVPHGVSTLDIRAMFGSNISLRGGVAPVRAYLPELLKDVIEGRLDPSPVLDLTVDLDGVPGGYAAMDERRAVKVMVRP